MTNRYLVVPLCCGEGNSKHPVAAEVLPTWFLIPLLLCLSQLSRGLCASANSHGFAWLTFAFSDAQSLLNPPFTCFTSEKFLKDFQPLNRNNEMKIERLCSLPYPCPVVVLHPTCTWLRGRLVPAAVPSPCLCLWCPRTRGRSSHLQRCTLQLTSGLHILAMVRK